MGSVIRVVAIVSSGIVLLGFALFAIDELDRGSQNQQNALAAELESAPERPATIAPSPDEERLREERNGDLREAIDDANDVLLAPFGGLVSSGNVWVANGVPTAAGPASVRTSARVARQPAAQRPAPRSRLAHRFVT